jgi:hypothetical protein
MNMEMLLDACIVAGHRPASKGVGSTAYGLVHHAS